MDQRLDIARIEGQVKASSIKKVADFVARAAPRAKRGDRVVGRVFVVDVVFDVVVHPRCQACELFLRVGSVPDYGLGKRAYR